MTLNQVENRIKAHVSRHKQVAQVDFGELSDYLSNKDSRYPACFLQDNNGTIDLNAKVITFNYRLFLLDVVNVSKDAKSNEREVMSDMLEIAVDVITLLDDPAYHNWKVNSSPFSMIKDEYADVVSGVVADISISALRVKDKCAVPKDRPMIFENVFPNEMP